MCEKEEEEEEIAEATAPQSKESVSELDALVCGLRASLLSQMLPVRRLRRTVNTYSMSTSKETEKDY